MRAILLFLMFITLFLVQSSCSTSIPLTTASPDQITVQGEVYVAGAEPFAGLLLKTDTRHSYVLVFDEAVRGDIERSAPMKLEINGTVYAGTWANGSHAHIRVKTWKILGQ